MITGDFAEKIFPSITGVKNIDWQNRLKEVEQFKLSDVAVFLENFNEKQRPHLYKALEKSSIKRVPFVHLRNDTDRSDVEFFVNKYGTQHFNIHEDSFGCLDQWEGYLKNLYLEMDYNDEVPKNVDMEKIGGFCIDLSHLKAAIARGSEDAAFVYEQRSEAVFACNHLNGYDPVARCDIHKVSDLEQFDYLKTLPEFVFSDIIAIETENSIAEQLKFKEYLAQMLNEHFGILR